jgi:pectate lyase
MKYLALCAAVVFVVFMTGCAKKESTKTTKTVAPAKSESVVVKTTTPSSKSEPVTVKTATETKKVEVKK